MLHRHGGVQAVHGLAAQLVDEIGIGRAGAQEGGVEARLARLANGADGLADDGAEHHEVASGRPHLGHLR
ncbi:hypothetical protein D3C71_1657730 [compost metagenome]